MQVNMPALDRKLRRRANRTQRQDKGLSLDLGKMQNKAEHDVRLRCTLGNTARHGKDAAERAAAAKAKRKLNDTWTNRSAKSLAGFWNPQA